MRWLLKNTDLHPKHNAKPLRNIFPVQGWVPANDKGRTGTRSLSTGLTWSINEVAAYLIKQTTPERFAEFIKQINIPTKVQLPFYKFRHMRSFFI